MLEVVESRQKQLESLERVIFDACRKGIDMFRALRQIKEDGLYSVRAKTFEAYCLNYWGITSRSAYRMIDALEVSDRIAKRVTVPEGQEIILESQLRELKDVPDASLNDVIEEAAELATEKAKPITAEVRTTCIPAMFLVRTSNIPATVPW